MGEPNLWLESPVQGDGGTSRDLSDFPHFHAGLRRGQETKARPSASSHHTA